MKIQSAGNTIERFGNVSETNSFSIRANRQAFEILSSKLYSNKPLAVIREYSCNAIDAHIAAGCPLTPIEVHLPTALEPYFSVKDFGTGLSHKDVLHLYTTYFESSKRDTNDQIGGLGLGSKSFFAYTDSFTVSSRFNGTKRTYTSFLNEEGIPDITLMSEEETTEPNGLEVSGAVKSSDFSTFKSNAKEFFTRVFPRPVITGETDLVIPEISYSYTGKSDWKLRTNGGNAVAIMGAVAYPIDLEPSRLSPAQVAVRNLPIDIKFNIGDLDVSASREKLSFNPTSVANVKAKFDSIVEEVSEDFKQKFASCRNLWAAKCLYLKLTIGEYSRFRAILDGAHLSWNGKRLDGSPFKLGSANPQNQNGPQVEVTCFAYNQRRRRKYAIGKVYEIEPNEQIQMFINDLPTGAITRCRYKLQQTGQPVFLVNLNGTKLSDFLAKIGREGDTIELASSLPKPPRASGTITEKGKAPVLELMIDDLSHDANECWALPDDSFDVEEGGLYVQIDRYQVNGHEKPRDYFNRMCAPAAGFIDFSTLQVFGFKNKAMDKVRNNPKWVSLSDYVRQQVTTRITENIVVQKYADYKALQKFEEDSFAQSFIEFAKPTNPKSEIVEFKAKLDLVKQNSQGIQDVEALTTLAKRYGVQVTEVPASFDLQAEFEAMFAKYPMLAPVRKAVTKARWYCSDMLTDFEETIQNYINELDNA